MGNKSSAVEDTNYNYVPDIHRGLTIKELLTQLETTNTKFSSNASCGNINLQRPEGSAHKQHETSYLHSKGRLNNPYISNYRKHYKEVSEELIHPTSNIEHANCSLCTRCTPISELIECSFPNCENKICWPQCNESYPKIFLPPEFSKEIDFSEKNLEQHDRPKIICHSHFCNQCFESNWRHYFYDKNWRDKAETDPYTIHNLLWKDLIYTCKNMTEKKHFEKKKTPLTLPLFPKLLINSAGGEYTLCQRCKAACCNNCKHPLSIKINNKDGSSLCHKCHVAKHCEEKHVDLPRLTPFLANTKSLAIREMHHMILNETTNSSRTLKFAKFETQAKSFDSHNSQDHAFDPEPFEYIKVNYATKKNKILMKCEIPTLSCECKDHCDDDCQNKINGIQCFSKICALGEIDCGNRLIPRCVDTHHLKSLEFSGKGIGITSNQNFDIDQLVCEYVGEVISSEEYHQRIKQRSMQEIDDGMQRHWYVMEVKNGVYIDSTHKGNLARFINHSCNPNCTIRVINVKGTYRMGIFSKQKIKIGEEITYSYGFKSKGIGRGFQCFCGSSNCVGQVGIGSSINKIFNEIHRQQKLKTDGNMSEWLQELTAHLTDNDYSNPYRLQRPTPSSILDGIIDTSEYMKQKALKFQKIEGEDPLMTGIKQKRHLSLAHSNYIRILHLNGSTLEDYNNSKTKKFAMDIPWALLASELSWPHRDAAREGCIFYDNFYFQARRHYQSQILAMSRKFLSPKDSDRLQSCIDKTWGIREVCSVCGEYGEVSVCDNCHEILHSQCIGIHINKKDASFLCLLCHNSNHRKLWYEKPEIEREVLGMKIAFIRLSNIIGVPHSINLENTFNWQDWSM